MLIVAAFSALRTAGELEHIQAYLFDFACIWLLNDFHFPQS